MKRTLKILPVITAIILSACQDVVQVKLDEGEKKYVIDAFINDLRSPQRVRVIFNNAYFSSAEPEPVPDATVILKDLTSGTQFQFRYENNGDYVYNLSPPDTIARIGHQYELNVTINGLNYTALTVQKRSAIMDTIISELIPPGSSSFGPPSADSLWMCTLSAFDITDLSTDYYWIKTFRNDTLLFGPADINVSIDGTNGPISIEGVPFTAFTPPVTFMGFKMYRSGNSCTAEIHSISRDTYFFFIQASGQINNTGLFATTPQNIKTNIVSPAGAPTRATGWFNMASVVSQKIIIR